MGLTKKTPHQISAVTSCSNSKKGVENLPRKSREPINDWAILDEIEAPMWADLTLECDSTYEDRDDEWFNLSHPFHQCSARKLLSTYYHSAKNCTNSAFDVPGPYSPKLQSSASKSGSEDSKRSEKEIQNNMCDGKVYDHLSHIRSSSSDKKKLNEASSQPFGYTSGLLLNLRNSLRKSCVTRQASRVDIKGTSQSEYRMSSSSKSSVGPSLHRGCDRMNSMVTENAHKTPNSKNVMTVSQLPINNLNRANLQKAPGAQAQNMSCRSDLRINRVASKTLVRKKQLDNNVTREVESHVPLATAKNSMRARGISNSSRSLHGGKENQSGKTVLVVKSSMRVKEADGPSQNPKAVKKNEHKTSDRTKLVGQIENYSCRSEVKKSMGLVKMIHFR